MTDFTRSGSCTTSRSSTRAVPSVGLTCPVRIRSIVVLPAPFGPKRPKNSPRSTVSWMPFSASTVPYRFVSPEASIAATAAPTRATLFRVRLLVIGLQEAKLFGPPPIELQQHVDGPIRLPREHVSERVVGGPVQRVPSFRLAGRERRSPSRGGDQPGGRRSAPGDRNPPRPEDPADGDLGDDRPRVAGRDVRMPRPMSGRREGQRRGLADSRCDRKVDGGTACDSRRAPTSDRGF